MEIDYKKVTWALYVAMGAVSAVRLSANDIIKARRAGTDRFSKFSICKIIAENLLFAAVWPLWIPVLTSVHLYHDTHALI
jgi:hypothetical protein